VLASPRSPFRDGGPGKVGDRRHCLAPTGLASSGRWKLLLPLVVGWAVRGKALLSPTAAGGQAGGARARSTRGNISRCPLCPFSLHVARLQPTPPGLHCTHCTQCTQQMQQCNGTVARNNPGADYVCHPARVKIGAIPLLNLGPWHWQLDPCSAASSPWTAWSLLMHWHAGKIIHKVWPTPFHCFRLPFRTHGSRQEYHHDNVRRLPTLNI
jgi:hypothetical protein